LLFPNSQYIYAYVDKDGREDGRGTVLFDLLSETPNQPITTIRNARIETKKSGFSPDSKYLYCIVGKRLSIFDTDEKTVVSTHLTPDSAPFDRRYKVVKFLKNCNYMEIRYTGRKKLGALEKKKLIINYRAPELEICEITSNERYKVFTYPEKENCVVELLDRKSERIILTTKNNKGSVEKKTQICFNDSPEFTPGRRSIYMAILWSNGLLEIFDLHSETPDQPITHHCDCCSSYPYFDCVFTYTTGGKSMFIISSSHNIKIFHLESENPNEPVINEDSHKEHRPRYIHYKDFGLVGEILEPSKGYIRRILGPGNGHILIRNQDNKTKLFNLDSEQPNEPTIIYDEQHDKTKILCTPGGIAACLCKNFERRRLENSFELKIFISGYPEPVIHEKGIKTNTSSPNNRFVFYVNRRAITKVLDLDSKNPREPIINKKNALISHTTGEYESRFIKAHKFSPDSRFIAALYDKKKLGLSRTLEVYDLHSENPNEPIINKQNILIFNYRRNETHGTYKFSPDGRFIATLYNKKKLGLGFTLEVYDLRSKNPNEPIIKESSVLCNQKAFEFSKESQYIKIKYQDGTYDLKNFSRGTSRFRENLLRSTAVTTKSAVSNGLSEEEEEEEEGEVAYKVRTPQARPANATDVVVETWE